MQLGKLPSDQLHRLLEQLPSHGSEVITGPKIGEDAVAEGFAKAGVSYGENGSVTMEDKGGLSVKRKKGGGKKSSQSDTLQVQWKKKKKKRSTRK